MKPISAAEAARRPVRTDEDIQERVTSLIGHARCRQVWMLYLDADDRQLPILIPMDNYPLVPSGAAADNWAARIREVMTEEGAAQLILVWERHAGERASLIDRAWAKAMAAACRDARIPLRAQLISHRAGVRWFPPDDYC